MKRQINGLQRCETLNQVGHRVASLIKVEIMWNISGDKLLIVGMFVIVGLVAYALVSVTEWAVNTCM